MTKMGSNSPICLPSLSNTLYIPYGKQKLNLMNFRIWFKTTQLIVTGKKAKITGYGRDTYCPNADIRVYGDSCHAFMNEISVRLSWS